MLDRVGPWEVEGQGNGEDGHFVVLEDCGTKFLLDIADAVEKVSLCDCN